MCKAPACRERGGKQAPSRAKGAAAPPAATADLEAAAAAAPLQSQFNGEDVVAAMASGGGGGKGGGKGGRRGGGKGGGKGGGGSSAAPTAAASEAVDATGRSAADWAASEARSRARRAALAAESPAQKKAKWEARADAAKRCAPREAVLDYVDHLAHPRMPRGMPDLRDLDGVVGFALRPCTRMATIDHSKPLKKQDYEPVYLVRGTFQPVEANKYGCAVDSEDDTSSDGEEALYRKK